jgi:hypothetical protein
MDEQDKLKKQTKEIEETYRDYTEKMDELKKEQGKILGEFLQEAEKEKIEEIRNKMKE